MSTTAVLLQRFNNVTGQIKPAAFVEIVQLGWKIAELNLNTQPNLELNHQKTNLDQLNRALKKETANSEMSDAYQRFVVDHVNLNDKISSHYIKHHELENGINEAKLEFKKMLQEPNKRDQLEQLQRLTQKIEHLEMKQKLIHQEEKSLITETSKLNTTAINILQGMGKPVPAQEKTLSSKL